MVPTPAARSGRAFKTASGNPKFSFSRDQMRMLPSLLLLAIFMASALILMSVISACMHPKHSLLRCQSSHHPITLDQT